MKSKIISIGDELLIGQTINTNAAFLGESLYKLQIPVEKCIVIGDEENILLNELKDSVKNYDITIITGGLGPTNDDITKTVLLKFFKDQIILNGRVLEHIKLIFSRRNMSMPEINIEQAKVPQTAEIIWNNNGTAPGFWFEKSEKVIVCLPGVPFEMKPMMENIVSNRLKEKFKSKIDYVLLQKTFSTIGISESALFEKIDNIDEILKVGKLAFLPSIEGVKIRIDVKDRNEESAVRKVELIESLIKTKIGEYIYGTDKETLQEIVGKLLLNKKATLSVAESCTGGYLSSQIVSIGGSSNYFKGGICSYTNDIKVNFLGIDKELISKFTEVSKEVALEMAINVRKKFNTDYSLAITGFAGPSSIIEEKVGLIWIAFSSNKKNFAEKFHFGNNRERNISRASQTALEILRKELADKN